MTLRGDRGVVLDQFKSLVSEVILGADYHGIHAFCIFTMKIPFFVMVIIKLKQEVETWGLSVCLHAVKPPLFLIFENISTKAPKEACPLHMMLCNIKRINE